MSVYHLGGSRFLLAEYLKDTDFSRELEALGAKLLFSEARQGAKYPHDAGLCALSIGGRVFHNSGVSDKLIIENTEHFYHTAQGYAKCAVCPVSGSAAITADAGMAAAMRAQGIDVLEISPTGISLPGFSQGFIGGAAFMLSKNTLAFSGDFRSDEDKSKIELFLQKNGRNALFLTKTDVFDFGSAIPIY